ncbi:MAG: PepSY domain-containing protein, partial [Alphaproteobacteria bacterium]
DRLGARADQDCAVPIELWQDKGAVLAEVKDKWGLAPKRLRIDDGCYAVTAYDTEGNELKILFDPQTLVPVELKIEFSGRADPAHYLGRIRPSTPCGSDCGEGDN